MTTREEAVALCLQFPGAVEDAPFHDPNWTVLRHGPGGKMFAAVFERQGRIWLNLKAEPLQAEFLCRAFAAVVPAYHMNKRHWVSVILDGSLAKELIAGLAQESFLLTARRPAKQRAQNAPENWAERTE